MTSILAWVSFGERIISPNNFEQVSRAAAWYRPEKIQKVIVGQDKHLQNVGLLRTLKRFTKTQGLVTQPYQDPISGRYYLVDARLDNRHELGVKLGLSQQEISSSDDCLLVAAADRRWGEQAPLHLIGYFVYIVWDPSQQQLTCVRDHGVRALFYYFDHNYQFVCSSDLTALMAVPGIPKQFDNFSLGCLALRQMNLGGHTFYKEVKQLQGGTSLILKDRKLKQHIYWSFEQCRSTKSQIDYRDPQDYYLHFGSILKDVVKQQVESVDQVATHLSGGLDSSSVACLAAQFLPNNQQQLNAYAYLADDEAYQKLSKNSHYAPDLPYIHAVLERYPAIKINYVKDAECSLFDRLDSVNAWVHAPAYNPFNRLWMEQILSQVKASGCSVLLCGQSGNLIASWRGSDALRSLLMHGRWAQLWDEAKSFHIQSLRSLLGLTWRRFVRPSIQPLEFALRRSLKILTWQCPYIQPKFFHESGAWDFRLEQESRYAEKPLDSKGMMLMGYDGVANSILPMLHAGYRLGLGVEIRDPLFDRRILEFCYATPAWIFSRHGDDRLLIRKGLAEAMPQKVLERRTRGLQGAGAKNFFELSRAQFELMIQQSGVEAESIWNFSLIHEHFQANHPQLRNHQLLRNLAWMHFYQQQLGIKSSKTVIHAANST